MKNELLMVIADAIARVASEYEIEIGPRGMVAVSSEVHDAVVNHFSDEPFAEPKFADHEFFADPSPAEPTDMDAYLDGFDLGRLTAEKTPLEIYDAGEMAAFDPSDVDPDFEAGFRAGLNDGYNS